MKLRGTKVAITGAGGFIGRRAAERAEHPEGAAR